MGCSQWPPVLVVNEYQRCRHEPRLRFINAIASQETYHPSFILCGTMIKDDLRKGDWDTTDPDHLLIATRAYKAALTDCA